MGSGLAIGITAATAIAAVVLLVSVMQEKPQEDVVSDTAPAVQPQSESTTQAAAPEVTQKQPEAVEPAQEVVNAQPETVDTQPAAVEVQPETVEEQADATVINPEPPSPSLDLVRIDENGSTVVAGKTEPHTSISITLDGKVIGEAKANASGAFVALIDIAPSDAPRELSLVKKQADGVVVASDDKVLVMPFAPETGQAPKLVVAKPGSVEVIAPKETETTKASDDNTTADVQVATNDSDLTLDTIVYDDLGDVVISGRGSRDDFVRIYLDNKPTDVQKVTDDGQWKITLSDVPEGLYDLRIDSVDGAGAVTERVQSPFKREATKLVAATGNAQPANVTIQPGYTLWALAEKRYGNGFRYVQIYDANRDRIKDPDLIYPGQVFDLPN